MPALSEPSAIQPKAIVDRTRNRNWIGVSCSEPSTR